MLLRSAGTAQGPGTQTATRMVAQLCADPNGTSSAGNIPPAVNHVAQSTIAHPPSTNVSSFGGGLATAHSSPRSPLDHKLSLLVDAAVAPLLAWIAELSKLNEQVCRTKQDALFTSAEAAYFAFGLD